MIEHYTYPTAAKPIHAQMSLSGSKSATNRALLIAALAQGKSVLKNFLMSDDTNAMQRALQALNVNLQKTDETTCEVQGLGGGFKADSAKLSCDDAGTVLRFLLPACAYSHGEFYFHASEQLTRRPIEPLIAVLQDQGVEFLFSANSNQLPFSLRGIQHSKIKTLFVPGDQSSQFLSGLLMAAPLLQHDLCIVTEKLISKPYVDMTRHIMADFGVTVQKENENTFYIAANQKYQASNYTIEPDLSTASYFFAAAAVTNGQITIKGIDRNTCQQGDIAFLDILEKMGCAVFSNNTSVTVQGPAVLQGISVNIQDCSDLFMTVACLAAFANSPTIIEGIQHIRLKESDRIHSTKVNLALLGIQLVESPDSTSVKIIPSHAHAATLDSFHDHRIVMAFALFGLKIPGITMNNMSCVSKTCPNFTTLWEKMLAGGI